MEAIPVQALAAAVAIGHILPVQRFGAAGADRVAIPAGILTNLGYRQRDPIGDRRQIAALIPHWL